MKLTFLAFVAFSLGTTFVRGALKPSNSVFNKLSFLPVLGVLQKDVEDDPSSPWFCHGLDCPNFQEEDVSAELAAKSVELRSYEETVWVKTDVDDEATYDAAVRKGFMRLFEYISGANHERQKIEMTSPVRVLITPGEGATCGSNFTVAFFLPRQLHAYPPTPKDPRVYVEEEGPAEFYVISFGGWASDSSIVQQAASLQAELVAAGVTDYDPSTYFFAGYDPPFRIFSRHNEIWMGRTPVEAGAAAAKVAAQ